MPSAINAEAYEATANAAPMRRRVETFSPRLTNTIRLAFWYELAQGMDAGSIIGMPEDYEPSSEAQDLVKQLNDTGFKQ